MMNTINTGIGGLGQTALSGLPQKSPEVALPVNTAPQIALPLPKVETPAASDEMDVLIQQRTDAIKEAITASLPRFFMPVSDVRFTIYKDSTGQYITRFTNIVSGETTQVPEPQLMNMISTTGIGGNSNFIQTSA
jgi:hypothetical protein